MVAELNQALGQTYQAAAGDETFVHITKKLAEDSKVVAIRAILKLLGLKSNQVATFGDMPVGNDAGLLSFPYSFTNADEFAKIKKNSAEPPYLLLNQSLTPVERVYKAIDYLIS